jgi:hypothetical protein
MTTYLHQNVVKILNATYLGSNRDTQEMYEPNVLVTDNFDLINQPEPAKIVPQLLFCRIFIQATEVYIPARVALADCKAHLRADRRWLPPSYLEFLAVKRELLDGGVRVERCSGCAVQKGQENTRFFGKNTNGFEGAKVHKVK